MNGQLRDLWEALRLAELLPEQVDMKVLLAAIDQAIAQTPEVERLHVAGEALLQVAELCAVRAEVLTTEWEAGYRDPIVERGFFAEVVRQTMGVDLSDLMEPAPIRKRRAKPTTAQPEGSIVAVVEKEAVLAMVEQLEAEEAQRQKQAVLAIAHSENVVEWVEVMGLWLQAGSVEQVLFADLCGGVGLTRVEGWLGVLFGGFEIEQVGEEFYGDGFWVKRASADVGIRGAIPASEVVGVEGV